MENETAQYRSWGKVKSGKSDLCQSGKMMILYVVVVVVVVVIELRDKGKQGMIFWMLVTNIVKIRWGRCNQLTGRQEIRGKIEQ